MTESPWPVCELDELLDSKPQYGFTSKALDRGSAAMLRTTDLTGLGPEGIEWKSVPRCEIDHEGLVKYQVREGDILVSRAGTVGVSFLVRRPSPGPAVFASYLIRLKLDRSRVSPEYVSWFTQSPAYWAQVTTMAAGVAQLNINATKLRELRLPVPSIAKQRDTVAAIERLISLLDAGVESVQRNCRRARNGHRAVVEACLAGNLGEDVTAAPAVRLAELASEIRNGGHWRAPEPSPPGTPILRIGAVRPMRLDASDVGYVRADLTEDEVQKFSVQPGSLLFTRYNGNPELVGACARVEESAAGFLHPDKLIRVDLGPRVLPEWVEIAAAGGMTRRHIETHRKTTAGQSGMSQTDLKQAPVPVPSLDVQRSLVQKTQAVTTMLRHVEHQLSAIERRAAALRRSILKAAFEGRLTRDGHAPSVDELAEEVA